LEILMRIPYRAFGAAGVVALLALPASPTSASAQQPPVARTEGREVVNWDFRPDGGFRRMVAARRAARRMALARRDISALNNSPSMAVSGTFNLPVVFLQYSDSVATGLMADTANFQTVFFSANPQGAAIPRPYSLKTYYEQVSGDRITMEGDFLGWVTTPNTFAFVGANCNAIRCANGLTRLGNMLDAALDSLNVPGRQVDWSQYDSDNDGYVDFVTFVHPAIGAECLGSLTTNNIWAHRFFMGPGGLVGSNYVTNTPRPGFPGQFIRIADYTIQGAQGGTNGCTSGLIMPMGTAAHETGHAFGIPDLYATSGDSEGIGEWGLMGSGNYTVPFSPAGWDAWSKVDVGWVNVDTLTTSENVTLNPVQTSDTVLIVPISATDEYLILENRANLLSDTAQMRVGFNRRKLPGLLIWHIDQSIIDAGRGQNIVNAGGVEGVRLIQADGLSDLQIGTDRGDMGDSYPGSTNNRRFTYTSTPAARSNAGINAGFVLDSIVQVSDVGAVTFRFRRSAPWRATSTGLAAGATITVNGVTATSFEEIFGLGDSISLSAPDTQLVAAGRTRLVFASWSDAGARSHVIVSDGTPDTVTATLAVSHRINFIANGTGTVGSSGPATNTFVATGTPVTLTATPTGGGVFTGWTGDTTTANASLVLPMGRPYSVTANFTGAVAVSYAQATNAILGITPLTGPQATYLDDVGNNNNVYDLGDYLAFLKANGFVTAPGLLKRVESGRGLAPRMEQ
jgi:M6 family metalloprotease-like protein